MRIAVFYPESLYSAWSVSEGIVDTLKRMGHEPLNCGVVPKSQTISKAQYPKFEELNECDAVLVSGPEHLGKYLSALYPEFKKLKARRLAWMHETVEREDYGRLPVEAIMGLYDTVFTPAAQDAKHGRIFLPFGVDTEMFKPKGYEREYDAVFIGLMYGPRAEFVKKHGLEKLIRFGKCEGLSVRGSARAYADELNRSKILVNLPSLCRHAVTKIFEGAACGCKVLTHTVEDERNHVLRTAGYYKTGEDLKNLLSSGNAVDFRGFPEDEIGRLHSLDQRLAVILQ